MGNCGSAAVQDSAGPGAKNVIVTGSTEDVHKLFSFDKVLGKGQFGVTRMVIEKSTGNKYACKTISKRKLACEDDIQDVRREIQIMHHLSGHPHVVEFKGAYEDPHHIHIVMELCSGGELFERIAEKGHFSEHEAAAVMRSIISVVAHCHAMNVAHRDLKPENFLLSEQSDNPELKAIDFGLSTFFQEGQVMTDLVGSPFYIAPEVLKHAYGKEADIWSCGVIMYILLCGWPPFYGQNTQQIFRAIMQDMLDLCSPPWDVISPAAKDCVKRMLVRDPAKRATAAEVLQHDWLKAQGVSSGANLLMQPEILQRMRKFAAMNKLKKEALKIIAASLPPEEIMGMRSMFQDIDKDGSGTITVQELKQGLMRKGADVAQNEIEEIMSSLDLDGNNTIDYLEFLAATVFLGKLERKEHMLRAFAYFDKDSSGTITMEELRQGLLQVGASDDGIEAIIAEVDKDGNGQIDYQEFCDMMMSDVKKEPSRQAKTSKDLKNGFWKVDSDRRKGSITEGKSPRGTRSPRDSKDKSKDGDSDKHHHHSHHHHKHKHHKHRSKHEEE